MSGYSTPRNAKPAGVGNTPQTPTGVRTEEEKKELQTLNKRFEFYILQQRDKDKQNAQLRADIADWKVKMRVDLEAEKKKHADMIKELRDERMRKERALREITVDVMTTQNRKQELIKEVEVEQARVQSLNDHVQQVKQNNAEIAMQNRDLMQNAVSTDDERASLVDKEKDMERALHNERERLHVARVDLQRKKEEIMDKRDVLAQHKALHRIELEKFKIADLAHMDKAIQSESHEENFDSSALIEQLQQENDAKARQMQDELRNAYEDKLHTYRVELEQLGHELAVLQDEAKRQAELQNKQRQLQDQLASIEGDLAAHKRAGRVLGVEKERALAEMQKNLNRKEEEFDRLHDANIGHASDLEAICRLLDGHPEPEPEQPSNAFEPDLIPIEEAVAPPSNKKRKKADSPSPVQRKKARSPTPEPEPEPEPEEEEEAAAEEEETEEAVAEDAPMEEEAAQEEEEAPTQPMEEEEEAPEEAAAAAEEEEPAAPAAVDAESMRSVLISGKDAYGDYITLLNGSEVDYETMSGWKLIFAKTQQCFYFPDVPLRSNGTFQIRSTSSIPLGFGEDGKGGYLAPGAWDVSGDQAVLVNPDEQLEADFDILPGDENEPEEEATKDEAGCKMM